MLMQNVLALAFHISDVMFNGLNLKVNNYYFLLKKKRKIPYFKLKIYVLLLWAVTLHFFNEYFEIYLVRKSHETCSLISVFYF